jgi:Cdc6-like AAA superfamily ATPase
LNSKEFLNWANKNIQTLWCPGIPGAGKTILASVVIKHLKDAKNDKEAVNKAGIACLYCEDDRREDQTSHSLLAAVLRQLAEQCTLLPAPVTNLYRSHLNDKSQHSSTEISSVLADVIRTFSQMFLVVDALDECSETNRRGLLLELRHLQEKTGMKLLATSRPTATAYFQRIFKECALLKIRANESDVNAVLDVQKEGLSKCVRNDFELWNRMKEGIAAAVDGM